MTISWYNVYSSILLIGIIIGCLRFKVINKSNKFFLLLIFATFISESIAHTMIQNGKSNFSVYHIFSPLQYSLVALGYYFDTRSKYTLLTIPLMIIISIFFSIWIQSPPLFNSYFLTIELFLFSILGISFFQKLLKANTETKLKNYPLFWISCGIILFSVSNLFIFGTHNFFKILNPAIKHTFKYLRYFTNYFYYIMYIFAFLVKQNNSICTNAK